MVWPKQKEFISHEGLKQTNDALDSVTSAANEHHTSPKDHLHTPAESAKPGGWLSRYLPSWQQIENMEQSYHLGNWVRDRQTDEKTWEAMSIYVRLGMHLLYYGTYQEELLQTTVVENMLKVQSEKMGKQYDDPASIAHIEPFIQSFGLQASLNELVQPDPTKYKTFNEFFAREIREDARPTADPSNASILSSPADCRITAFPTMDLATKFWIKGADFTMARLLQDDELAQTFDGGSMVIARLAPQDYHRWHAPVSGTVISTREIPGAYFTVNPQAINEAGTMNVYCENRRSVMIVERSAGGPRIAIVAVGAMLVGSIKYQKNCDVSGTKIRRGQCIGAFYYGGSTVLVLFPKSEVVLDEDLVKCSTDAAGPCETLVKVGWKIGTLL